MSKQTLTPFEHFTQAAKNGGLEHIGHGIEKESLRIDSSGHIAHSLHPAGLGSTLTHPHITTDFSEALVEFITPVYQSAQESLDFLVEQHCFLYSKLDPLELLWTSSMPCILGDDSDIPLAQYGSSNIGKLKTLYREGLGHRYGRAMQTIAGIHYNFSLPMRFWQQYQKQLGSNQSQKDFITDQYFNLIRNFRRNSWLLLYLFGSSPAVCKSFLRDSDTHGLEEFDPNTLFSPNATSLRMGDLGYTSDAQAGLYISYNSLGEYAHDLVKAIQTPYPPYESFTGENGQHCQLNTSILQIENEFYSTIRPKRVTASGKRPVHTLLDEGVEYIEVRLLDLNPFLPVGIDETQINFLNCFLLHCLFQDSPNSSPEEHQEIEDNFKKVVRNGRDPELTLTQNGKQLKLLEWANDIMTGTTAMASLLDDLSSSSDHCESVKHQQDKLTNSELTPSAQVLQRMRELKTPYFTFAMNQSLANSDFFRGKPLPSEKQNEFDRVSRSSNLERKAIEENDNIDFDTFLKKSNNT